MGEQIARYKPGENVPGFAGTAVLAGRFVAVTGAKTSSGDYPIAHAGAGVFPFGVAEADSAAATEPAHSVERRVNVVRRGTIARVIAGDEIAAAAEVMVGTGGKALELADDVEADAATLTVGAGNAKVKVDANEPGTGGNAITLAIIDPAGNNVALSVDVDGNDIIVTGATDGASALTSTADDVIAILNEDNDASQLVTASDGAASTGADVVAAVAETALAGGSDAGAAAAVGRALTAAEADLDVIEVDLY